MSCTNRTVRYGNNIGLQEITFQPSNSEEHDYEIDSPKYQHSTSVELRLSQAEKEDQLKKKRLFPPRLELGTFRVLGERDNHYTTETSAYNKRYLSTYSNIL